MTLADELRALRADPDVKGLFVDPAKTTHHPARAYDVYAKDNDGYPLIENVTHETGSRIATLFNHLPEIIAALEQAPKCDGGCSYVGPDETCSAHGRRVAEVWEIVNEIAAERDALKAQVEAVRGLHRRGGLYEPCVLSDCTDDDHDHFETGDGERVHADERTGWACFTCREDDGEPYEWPCPTIRALDGE